MFATIDQSHEPATRTLPAHHDRPATSQRPSNRAHRTLHRTVRAFAVLLVALLGVGAVGAGQADAMTATRGGSYGGYSFSRVGGQYVSGGLSGLRIQGPYVTRSNAAAGNQTVWFQATVEQYYGGRWVTVWNSGLRGTTLVPGQSRYLPNMYAPVGRGHFRVKEFLYWQNSAYRNLGYAAAQYDNARDYYCSIARCAVRPGYITL